MNLKECVDRGFLVEEKVDERLIHKELEECIYDFAQAERAFQEKDYKWCIIKCYYSMFHSGKAVCFQLGYREKKHVAVLIVLEELYKKGKLQGDFVNYFKAAIDSREGADYQYTYSKEIAAHTITIASKFNTKIKELIKQLILYTKNA